MSLSLQLPYERAGARGIDAYRAALRRAASPPAQRGAPSTASPTRRRMWWPTRWRASTPGCEGAIDWDATIAYRRHLWSLGPRRGRGDGHGAARHGPGLADLAELIRRSLTRRKHVPGALIACGCGTDHLAPDAARSVDDVIRAYEEQMAAIEALGGRIILMASRALARVARGPDDYARVYDRILSQAREPVILHWLGEMFDPALAGYWGDADHRRGDGRRLDVISRNAAKVDGIKISLLDKDKEIAMRRRLPPGVRMYTGDDFNYAELIAGDDAGLQRRAARHLRRHRAGGLGRARRAGGGRRGSSSTPSWRRPCRCRATSSRRRRASTRPAWCSWPS